MAERPDLLDLYRMMVRIRRLEERLEDLFRAGEVCGSLHLCILAGDQLFNHAGKARYISGGQRTMPLVVRTQQGTAGGKAAQHSQSLEAIFCRIPGWKVVAPYTPADAKGLLKTAIRDDNPVPFLEHKGLYFTRGVVPDGDEPVPLGKAGVARPGGTSP